MNMHTSVGPAYLDDDFGHPEPDTLQTANYPAAIRVAAQDIPAIIRLMITAGRLTYGPGRLSPAEFFAHRLWDPAFAQGDLRRFAGLLGQARFHGACCDLAWKAIADDKLVTASVLRAGGITATPSIIAVVHPTRGFDQAAHLRSKNDLVAFLRNPANYPLFAKPIDGVFSVGIVDSRSVDLLADTVRSATGAILPVPAIAARILHNPAGHLIQRTLAPAALLASMTGGRLCTVRLLVLLANAGPVIHRAVLKVPTGNNIADNYWRAGNRIGAIDLATGQVTRVVTGKAETLRRDPHHPDTGQAIEGATIPDWPYLRDLTRRAAQLFPGIRTQSWDVAITDRGPVLLEVNWGGDLHLHQIAHGAGILDAVFCGHLRSCSYRGKLPA